MPPPKKAAKKAAKKAPKKGSKPHHDQHHGSKDLRRAFEHLGRVEVLQQALQSPFTQYTDVLSTMAQQQLKAGESKDAAELLRGAEHLLFAALVGKASEGAKLSPNLHAAVEEQFEELGRKADEHWDDAVAHPASLASIYKMARSSALDAFESSAFHKALEFARAAEALAHVRQAGSLHLDTSGETGKLSKSTR